MALPKPLLGLLPATNMNRIGAAFDAIDGNTAAIGTNLAAINQLYDLLRLRDPVLFGVQQAVQSLQSQITGEGTIRANDLANESAARVQADLTLSTILLAVSRPGDNPTLFTAALAGAPASCPPITGGSVVTTPSGLAYRVNGSALCAPRRAIPIDPSRVYASRSLYQRVANPTDPAGSAVRVAVRWLSRDYRPLGDTVVDQRTATVANGLVAVVAKIGGANGLVPLTGTAYAKLYLQTFDLDGVTDFIDVGDPRDVTDATSYSPDLTAITGRVSSLEQSVATLHPLAAGAGNGLATLDADAHVPVAQLSNLLASSNTWSPQQRYTTGLRIDTSDGNYIVLDHFENEELRISSRNINNVFSVANLKPEGDGVSALTFRNYINREQMAIGYGNPNINSNFKDTCFIETTGLSTQYGFSDPAGPKPFKIIQTGLLGPNATLGNHERMFFDRAGNIILFCAPHLDLSSTRFRFDGVKGNLSLGNAVHFAQTDSIAPLNIIEQHDDTKGAMLLQRWGKTNVGKFDLVLDDTANQPLAVRFRATDQGAGFYPLAFLLDGSNDVVIGGTLRANAMTGTTMLGNLSLANGLAIRWSGGAAANGSARPYTGGTAGIGLFSFGKDAYLDTYDAGGGLILRGTNYAQVARFAPGHINLTLPTSASGLSAGDLWRDNANGGVVKAV